MSKTKQKSADVETKEDASLPTVQSLENTAVITSDDSLNLGELEQDAGAGLQEVSAQDLATPLIYLLQSGSPQCKKADARFIPGATEGMLLNNVTGQVYDGDKGILVVPCYFEKVFIEWKAKRGGLAAIHPATTPLKEQVVMQEVNENGNVKYVPTLPNGNTLVETNQHYVLLIDEENKSFEPAVISMASSQLRTSRVWNSLMKRVQLKKANGQYFTPASYYMTYRLTTQAKTKDTNSWFVFAVEPAGPVQSKALYETAKAFEKAVSSGKVKVKHDDAHAGEATSTEASDDDAIPFD